MWNRSPSKRRRGAVLVFVGVSLIMLLLVASLAIDVGYICALTAEQQNNADAAALACASALQDGVPGDAETRARDILGLNQQPQGYVSLDDQLVQLGQWDRAGQTFTVADDVAEASACRVVAARNNAPLFFAAIAGHLSTDVTREAVAIAPRPCGGIWGLEGIRINGNVETDSYDSTEAPYSSVNAGDNGDLCSGMDIDIRGSVEIHGDAVAGMGYQIDIRGPVFVAGVQSATLSDVEPPPHGFGDVASVNDNHLIGPTTRGRTALNAGRSIRLTGNDTLTVPPGRYYWHDVNITSGSAITFTGPTLVYMTGTLDTTGTALINRTGDPANLTIISTGSTVRLVGTSDFYGSILAPYADLQLGGTATWYGAVVARTIWMHGNFNFHVDESLPLTKPWNAGAPPQLVK